MSQQLDNLDRLREAVADNHAELLDRVVEVDEIYCPGCSGRRRVKLTEVTMKGRDYGPRRKAIHAGMAGFGFAHDPNETPRDRALRHLTEEGMAPALFTMQCVQCGAGFTAVVYEREGEDALAVFPDQLGGLTTKHTPNPVAYYLDQAARSQAAGAFSAAVAMYRVALEQMLEVEGYHQRMCGPKLAALEADIKAGKAPKWASVDQDVMGTLKDLGNGVLHTNGGDITLQENATPELLENIALAFEEILDVVIERPVKAQERKTALKQAADKMKK